MSTPDLSRLAQPLDSAVATHDSRHALFVELSTYLGAPRHWTYPTGM